ncbi:MULTISPECIES: hypothetical protein [Ruoffia]|jgi:hypothetical protein|uniref:Uncharacterized protein n=1 Tax=Ruoffia tabacinasalis TaxID=87458 RepID=A0A5R9DVT6_9LACT|nr:hypothetical protein [Ruoffia tabacinasalis]MBG9978000.1 hypothetical protein [Ruoffia tabacinasalis]TLQ41647.1 hypothetical protein FEZ33_05140 [Ruoffia tabacinasalis]HJG48470.1 hypothetical protein [Ruoffia tabacinasalis]
MRQLKKLLLSLSLISFINYPIQFAQASEDEEMQEELAIREEVDQDFKQVLDKLEASDKYKITLRYMNVDSNKLLAEGEILADSISGDARLTFDIYEYGQDNTQSVSTYDIVSYREFSLAYINTINLLTDTGFFEQTYFPQNVQNQLNEFNNYYIAINQDELGSINMNEELIDNLLYFPDLSQIEDISTDDIYQLNDSTIIDMERLEIPRGFYQNAGSFSLNYSLNVDINESDDRHISYDVIPNQQFNITENSRGLTFQSTLSSQITDDLISSRRLDNREFPADYQWESNISTNHVTDKLTKATISINPEVGSYNATLTGLYEQFMLNIFSNKTADIESFNYRLELSMTPSEEKIPEINELNKMTMSEFSYLMESVLTAENQRYDNDTQLLN